MTGSIDDVRLPDDYEQGAKGGPQFLTSVISLSGGVEQRVGVWEQELAPWDIGWGIQSMDELAVVEAFFYDRRGKLRGFRFKDWHDFECVGQKIGTGDGVTRTFLIGKTYGPSDPSPFFRRLTRIVAGTVVVYVDGVEQSASTYDVGLIGGWVKFHVGLAPANTKIVTVDCQFDIPVRFDVDNLKAVIYWVQAGQIPSLPLVSIRDVVNGSPTVTLANVTSSLPESTSTASRVKVADVVVTDDPFGTNELSLSGTDVASFELFGTLTIDGTGVGLYVKAGTVLAYDTKNSYAVTVNVKDQSISLDVLSHVDYTLSLTAVEDQPTVALTNLNLSLAWNQSTVSHVRVADVVVTQHHPTGTNNILSLTGTNASVFEFGSSSGNGTFTTSLYVKAGTAGAPNSMSTVEYDCTVNVKNADFGAGVLDHKDVAVFFGVSGSTLTDNTPGTRGWTVPQYSQLDMEIWGGGAGAPGKNAAGQNATESHITAYSMVAGPGLAPLLSAPDGSGNLAFNTAPGAGGVATGGDTRANGAPGTSGFYQRQTALTTITSGAGGSAPGSGGAGGAAATATRPATPYSGSQCSPAPPQPYPVPGTVTDANGGAGAAPGAGGAGSATMGWELILALATGYCWYPFAQARPGAGAGGYVKKTYHSADVGAPAPGATITYTVGAKGLGGTDSGSGGDGANGRVKFTVS